ncbi:MAG: hypothetical protein J7497_02110, partial [Chitinophagaceae bacterium]|nr:hypothetical protein [Chitinophagaceae bacterium]
MRRIFLLTLILNGCFIFSQTLLAQNKDLFPKSNAKPIIDSAAIINWPYLNTEPSISNNGAFFSYGVFTKSGGQVLIIQSTGDSARLEVSGASQICFSNDSKKFVYARNDSLFFLSLSDYSLLNITDRVSSWKQPKVNTGRWLAWQQSDSSNTLLVHDLTTGRNKKVANVADYSFDDQGEVLVIKSMDDSLVWLNLVAGTSSIIRSPDPENAASVISYSFDKASTQLVVIIGLRTDQGSEHEIWYYRVGMKGAKMMANNRTEGKDAGLFIGSSANFSNDGRYIYASLQPGPDRSPEPGYVKVDIC